MPGMQFGFSLKGTLCWPDVLRSSQGCDIRPQQGCQLTLQDDSGAAACCRHCLTLRSLRFRRSHTRSMLAYLQRHSTESHPLPDVGGSKPRGQCLSANCTCLTPCCLPVAVLLPQRANKSIEQLHPQADFTPRSLSESSPVSHVVLYILCPEDAIAQRVHCDLSPLLLLAMAPLTTADRQADLNLLKLPLKV